MDTESGEEKEEVKKQPKKRYKEAEKEIEGEEEYNEEDDDNEYRSGKKRESGGTATVFSCKRKCLETTASKGSKSLGKKAALSGKGKAKAAAEEEAEQSSGPSKEELRATISDILKKVDFNVATFSDIVKKLGVHYKMNTSAKKVIIKMLIQEKLTKLEEEEAEENEDEQEYEEPVKKASAAEGKKASLSGKGKAKAASEDAQAEQSSGPNKEELRATISDILKKVDFNVATFSDLVKKLGVHYQMDMSAKKVIINMLIQEELAKLVEAEENHEEEECEEPVNKASALKGKGSSTKGINA